MVELTSDIDFSQILVDSGTPIDESSRPNADAHPIDISKDQSTSPSIQAQDLAATILSMDLNTQHSVLSALLSKSDQPVQRHSSPTSPYPFVNPTMFSQVQLPNSASLVSLPGSTQTFLSTTPMDGLAFNSQLSPSMTPMSSVFSPLSAFTSSCPPSQQIPPVNLPLQLLQQQLVLQAANPFGQVTVVNGDFSPLTSPALRPDYQSNFPAQNVSFNSSGSSTSPFLPPSNHMPMFPRQFPDPAQGVNSQTQSPTFPSPNVSSSNRKSKSNLSSHSRRSSSKKQKTTTIEQSKALIDIPMDGIAISDSLTASPVFEPPAGLGATETNLLNSLRTNNTTNPSTSPSPVDLDKAMPIDSNLVQSLSNIAQIHPFLPTTSVAPLTPAELMKLPHDVVSGTMATLGNSTTYLAPTPVPNQQSARKRKNIQSDEEDSVPEVVNAEQKKETRHTVTRKSSISKPSGSRSSKASNQYAAFAESQEDVPSTIPFDTRKTSHKAAEQKRRDSLKHCFDDLRKILPPVVLLIGDEDDERRPGEGNVGGQRSGQVDPSNPNKGVSKVALLRRSNEYIIKLHDRMSKRDQTIRDLRETICQLRAGKIPPIQDFESEQDYENEPFFNKSILGDVQEESDEEPVISKRSRSSVLRK